MDFYLKYLKQCSEISKFSSTSLCKILLSWFPGGDQDIYSKNLSKKVKKTAMTKKQKQHYSQFYLTAKEALPPYVKWSFLTWTESIFGFDSKIVEHMDILEFLTFIIIGDLFSIVLRYCEDLDKSLLTLILNNTIELFTDISLRQFGIWINNNMIFDQWSYVVRRLSFINPNVVSEIFKSRMKNLTNDQDILLFLKIFRYYQVDFGKEKLEGFKEVLNHYISLISTFKKNQVVKEGILENLDLLFRQVDFVTQPEATLFEKQYLDIVKEVKEWEKKCSGSFKRAILFFLSTYTTHYTWQNFDKIIDESVQKLLKNYRKTTNVGGAIESITRLLEDKSSMDPKLFLSNTLNSLEKNDEFSNIVYYEPLREILAFTLDESKETQQRDYNGFILKKKYITKVKEVCTFVHNDIFLGKTKPPISSKEPVEEVIFFYTNYLIRICAINLELGLKTLTNLLSEKNKTWELFLISLHVITRIINGKDSQNSEIKAIHQNWKMVQDFLKNNSTNFLNIMKMCEDFVGLNSVGNTPIPFSVYSYRMKNQPLEDSTESTNDDQEISDLSPMHTESFVKSQSSNLNSENESEAESEKEDEDISSKSLSFTGLTPEEVINQKKKDEKLVQKRLANSTRSKKSNKLQYLLYLELLKLLPYIQFDSLIKTKESKSFIGSKLVQNDTLVARYCSNSLQQYIYEQKDESIRESIISGILQLVEENQEVSQVITLFDNLNLMINFWTESIKEEKNMKNLQKEEVMNFMSKYWNEKDLWINKLETLILIHLCFYEKKLRSSCFQLMKTISEYVKSKRVIGFESNYTPRTTLFDMFEKKADYIVQKANYLYIVKSVNGLRNDAHFPDDYAPLYDHSQREDSPYLWSFILSEIAKTLIEENYIESNDLTLFSSLKTRIQALQTLDTVKHLAFDDSNGIKYTNFLVLRMASSGIKENEGNIESMKNYNTEISLLCQSIFKGFKSELQWVRNAIIYSSSSVHYLNLGILFKNLNEYIITQTKAKTKLREDVLHFVATILITISNTIEFKKSFYSRTTAEKDNSILTIQSLNSIFKHFINFINEISYPKMKTASHIEKTIKFELEVCVTLYNLASAAMNMNSLNILKDETVWTMEDRNSIIQMLQLLSGFGEKAQNPNRKPKIDPKKVSQEQYDQIAFALPEMIKRTSQETIVLLLKLNPIYKKDDAETLKQLDWFEKAETRGFNTLSSLLYYHLDQLMDHYISRLYTETEDHLLSAYLIGIHDMINPLSNYYYAINSGVISEVVLQLKESVKVEKPPKIQKYAIQLLHACLWAINHRNVSVHNYAFQLLCVLAENGFDYDLPTDETDRDWEINKRKQESEILKKYASAMRTHSDYSLSVYVEQVSYILSQSHSSMTTALFTEALNRIDKISIPDRKQWELSVLKPWVKYIDLSKETFLDKLFTMTLNLSKQSGFFGDLKNLWQDLALGDWQKSRSNFSIIVALAKKNCYYSELRPISKEIILSLYQVQPNETVEEIVQDFDIEKCQKEQVDEKKQSNLLNLHKADVLFLMDLFCETQIIQPLILNIPIIFNFILTHYDKDPENMKILLKNILLRATTQPTKISQLLEMKNLTIHFRKDYGKKIIQQLTTQGIEDSSLRYGYINKSIMAHDLVSNFSNIIEKHFSPSIVEQMGDYALRNATKVDNTDNLFKLISIYSSILKPLNGAAVQKMIYVLISTSKMLDENKQKKSKNQVENEYISLMILFLQTLRDQCNLLPKTKLNSAFWTCIIFLSSPIPEIYSLAFEIFELFRKDKDNKFFSQEYQQTLSNYSKNILPGFQGYLFLLLKGLCSKEIENNCIQSIIDFNSSDFSSGFDIVPERRYLTAFILCLPYIYREGSNDIDKISSICLSFSEYFKGDLSITIKNIDLLKSNLDDYIQKICIQIVKEFFPIHSQKVAEILYSLSFGIQENLPFIFKITKYFLEGNNSKEYLNYFIPIIRISIGYSKFTFDQINLLTVSSLKISKERGDSFNVSQSSKLLGVQNNPMKFATPIEIENSLNEIFIISLKEVSNVEKLELKESFDFQGITIYDTTLSPNSKQYLITKPIKDKDTTRNVDINDIKPSQIRMEEEMKNKAEKEKKEKEEMERKRVEDYLRQKKEREEQQKQNQYIVSCLQKFALQWREKAREIKEETQKKEYTVLEKLLSDSETSDLLIEFSKTISESYSKDVLFCQDVLDFIEEKERRESVLLSKDLMERFIKTKTFELEENTRSNTIIDYGANQSDPKKTLFDSAFSQVSQRIEKNVLDKFLASKEYQNYEMKIRRKTKK